MAKRTAEVIVKEITGKMIKRSDLMNRAKEIIITELEKCVTVSYRVDEEENLIYVEGNQYGKAELDINHWFGQIRESDPPENLARDMMEDIKNQLLPERDYSM